MLSLSESSIKNGNINNQKTTLTFVLWSVEIQLFAFDARHCCTDPYWPTSMIYRSNTNDSCQRCLALRPDPFVAQRLAKRVLKNKKKRNEININHFILSINITKILRTIFIRGIWSIMTTTMRTTKYIV